MSGWALERDDAPARARNPPRRVFFGDDDDTVDGGRSDVKKRDSFTLTARRSQRTTRTELVVDDSDDGAGPIEDVRVSKTKVPTATEKTVGKADEVGVADIVRRTSDTTKAMAAPLRGVTTQYVHWLVRNFLEKNYAPAVVAIFDKEQPVSPTEPDAVHSLHAQLTSGLDSNQSTHLEDALVAWDARTHRRTLVRPRRRSTSEASETEKPPTKSKTTSGSRRKPQLSVTVASDEPVQDNSGDFNRLNHPGHTPKAQGALLAAVIGEPGSTPKASASELKMLGFEDLDDTTSLVPTPCNPAASDEDDDDGDGLSKYAQRKRAAQRHNKHVRTGEPGGTPTKEYVFFRETPPRFVTETIEEAEHVLRSIGGNPDAKRQQLMAAKMERFVELQSSDVAKYTIGQRVENLGAQRNISGLISKLYGSRQCGMAGPGTVVIDSWFGSDTAPMGDDEELLPVATRPPTPGSNR